MPYDIVIRGGTVVDGSGLGSFRADVGLVDGRIGFIGRISERGSEEIEADGHVVTPGFIDGHTHMDAQVFWDASGSSSCWHGVTSAVMGNCGFTLAPVRSDQRALVVRNLERAEDIDPAALAEGIDWNFETFPEYLDAVDNLDKGINFAANRPRRRISGSCPSSWLMRCVRAPSVFRLRASSTTRHRTTGPSHRGWRRGKRWPPWSGSWATWGAESSKG